MTNTDVLDGLDRERRCDGDVECTTNNKQTIENNSQASGWSTTRTIEAVTRTPNSRRRKDKEDKVWWMTKIIIIIDYYIIIIIIIFPFSLSFPFFSLFYKINFTLLHQTPIN